MRRYINLHNVNCCRAGELELMLFHCSYLWSSGVLELSQRGSRNSEFGMMFRVPHSAFEILQHSITPTLQNNPFSGTNKNRLRVFIGETKKWSLGESNS